MFPFATVYAEDALAHEWTECVYSCRTNSKVFEFQREGCLDVLWLDSENKISINNSRLECRAVALMPAANKLEKPMLGAGFG